MCWMVTQLCSEFALRPTRSRRSARLSVARLQSAATDSGLRAHEMCTRQAPLRGYVLVDLQQQQQSVRQSVSQRAGLGCFIVSKCKIPTQVGSSALARLFAARPEAISVGSDAWVLLRRCSSLGASLRGTRPQPKHLVSAFAPISSRTKKKSDPFAYKRKLFRFANFTSSKCDRVKI